MAAVIALSVIGCASNEDDSESAAKRCASLRDHLIELRLEGARDAVDRNAHREALRQAIGADFVDKCQERPMGEINCALSAKDTSAVAACSPSQE